MTDLDLEAIQKRVGRGELDEMVLEPNQWVVLTVAERDALLALTQRRATAALMAAFRERDAALTECAAKDETIHALEVERHRAMQRGEEEAWKRKNELDAALAECERQTERADDNWRALQTLISHTAAVEAARDAAVAKLGLVAEANVALHAAWAEAVARADTTKERTRQLVEHIRGFHDDNHHGGHTEPFADCAWDLCEHAALVESQGDTPK